MFKIRVFKALETFFNALGAEKARQFFAICSDCGRNRYTSKPCVDHNVLDGPEVNIIRREQVNTFADWQDQNA